MTRHIRPRGSRRAVVELALAALAAFFAALSVLWTDWIEVFGIDPDQGSGSLERVVPLALAVVALGLAIASRLHWKVRTHAAV